VKKVFHEHRLARGLLIWRGRRVEPSAVSRTALMTVEGEDDDVSGAGQTRATHDLCVAVPAAKRAHYVQPGVGHFGTFHGRRWREEILPRLSAFIRASA